MNYLDCPWCSEPVTSLPPNEDGEWEDGTLVMCECGRHLRVWADETAHLVDLDEEEHVTDDVKAAVEKAEGHAEDARQFFIKERELRLAAEAERDEARTRAEKLAAYLDLANDTAKRRGAERDALRDRPPTREELEYARAMVLLKQRHEDPLGDDLSDHVYRLVAQAEAARKMANDAIIYGDRVDAPNLLAAMDEAAK